MEEDKKKEVLGNGLASESEPTAVVKVFCSFGCSGVKIKLSCILHHRLVFYVVNIDFCVSLACKL